MCDHIDFLRYPIDGSLNLLGKKWAIQVFMEMIEGHTNFNALLRAIPTLSPRTLSIRLDDLEKNGLILREPYNGSIRVSYRLTAKGEEMRSLLAQIAGFSLRWHIPSATKIIG